jgi:hypothetical protein
MYQERWHDDSPTHYLVTTILKKAVELQADAICFGFHPDIYVEPETPEMKEQREKAIEQIKHYPKEQWIKGGQPLSVYELRTRIFEESARLRCPDRETSLPMSMRIKGVLHYFDGMSLNFYGMVMSKIQHRTVSIGATEESPQPTRYIQIGFDEDKRRFIEVDLEFRKDNSFWVYIRGERIVERGVNVSRTILGN